MGVRSALLFKKVMFCSFHFRMNHLPLSGPSQSKFKQPFGNQHQVFFVFYLSLCKLACLPMNSGKTKRDRFTFTYTEIQNVLLEEMEVCFGPTAL